MADPAVLSASQRLRRGSLLTQQDKKERKQGLDKKRHKSRINIGEQVERWTDVKVSIGLARDEDVAKMLLDSWCLVNSFFVDDENVTDGSSGKYVQTVHIDPHTGSKITSAVVKKKSLSQEVPSDNGDSDEGCASDVRGNPVGPAGGSLLEDTSHGAMTHVWTESVDVGYIKKEPEVYSDTEDIGMSYSPESYEDDDPSGGEEFDRGCTEETIQSTCDGVRSAVDDKDVVLDLSCSEEEDIGPVGSGLDQYTSVPRPVLSTLPQSRTGPVKTVKIKQETAHPRTSYRQSQRLQKLERKSYNDDEDDFTSDLEDEDRQTDDGYLGSMQNSGRPHNFYPTLHPKKRPSSLYTKAEKTPHPQTQCMSTQTDERPNSGATQTDEHPNAVNHNAEETKPVTDDFQGPDTDYNVEDSKASVEKFDSDTEFLDAPEADDSDYDPELDAEPQPPKKKRKYTRRHILGPEGPAADDAEYDPELDAEPPPPRKKRKYTKRKKSENEMRIKDERRKQKAKKKSEKEVVKGDRVTDRAIEDDESEKRPRAKRKSRIKKGEQMNCLPGSRRSDKYFPEINVQLEDHEDKYEVTTWTSHCKKDRGVDVEQKSYHGYACKVCGGVFKTTDRSVMEVHIKEHIQGKLTCGECGMEFSYYTQLRKHRLKLHVEAKYTCEECGEQFHYIKVLHTHLSKAHNKNVYPCKKCQVYFQTHADRKAHSLEVHPECFEKCEVCGETVNMTLCKNAMNRHMLSYWCQRTSSSICEICGKEVQRLSIKTHIRRVHHKTKTLRCDICDFSTHLGSTYRLHMMTHTGEHPVKCSLCDFSCIRSYQLTSHMRTHTGDKPYKCNQCSYASAWNVQLKDHKKAHVSDDRINCDTCHITFKDRRGLNTHISKEHGNTNMADAYMVKRNRGSTDSYPVRVNPRETNHGVVDSYGGQPMASQGAPDSYIVPSNCNLAIPNSYNNIRGHPGGPDAYVMRGGNLY